MRPTVDQVRRRPHSRAGRRSADRDRTSCNSASSRLRPVVAPTGWPASSVTASRRASCRPAAPCRPAATLAAELQGVPRRGHRGLPAAHRRRPPGRPGTPGNGRDRRGATEPTGAGSAVPNRSAIRPAIRPTASTSADRSADASPVGAPSDCAGLPLVGSRAPSPAPTTRCSTPCGPRRPGSTSPPAHRTCRPSRGPAGCGPSGPSSPDCPPTRSGTRTRGVLSTFRRSVAAWLARNRGMSVQPDEVIVVAGVAQALALLARVLRADGIDAVAVEDPGSRGAREQLRSWGIDTPPVPVDAGGIRVDALTGQRRAGGAAHPGPPVPDRGGAGRRPPTRTADLGGRRRDRHRGRLRRRTPLRPATDPGPALDGRRADLLRGQRVETAGTGPAGRLAGGAGPVPRTRSWPRSGTPTWAIRC